MVWTDAKITPDEKALLICACFDRTYRAFYSNGDYWSADGRLMKITPRKWIYEKDVVKDSFF
jgi:hypothetical protein